MPPVRRILHLDMDAFFASIEQQDDPTLKGLPVIVGNSARGVVCAASYEARKFGIHSAMAVVTARRLCPRGIFLPVRGSRYREVSRQVMAVLDKLSPLVEKASIDEAYVDITGTELLHGPPRELAFRVKAEIRDTTGLTCSIGIAPNKLLAKIGSDWKKPDGLTVIEKDQVEAFMAGVHVGKIPGVGKRTEEVLHRFGIRMCSDIGRYPVDFWESSLGVHGLSLLRKARGQDDSPVTTGHDPKSCSVENTFDEDTWDLACLERQVTLQAERVGRSLRSDGFQGRTVTLKLKFHDFQSITRRKTLARPTDVTEIIRDCALALLRQVPLAKKVRLIGVGVSGFSRGGGQLRLEADEREASLRRLDQALDRIASRFGSDAVSRGEPTAKKPKG
jgi:DNA polymerase IV